MPRRRKSPKALALTTTTGTPASSATPSMQPADSEPDPVDGNGASRSTSYSTTEETSPTPSPLPTSDDTDSSETGDSPIQSGVEIVLKEVEVDLTLPLGEQKAEVVTTSAALSTTNQQTSPSRPALLPAAASEVVIHERIGKYPLLPHIPAPPPYRVVDQTIYFQPYAWEKLKFLRDYKGGPTEVTCYGVSFDPKDPLIIGDIIVPKQRCTAVTVDIDTDDLAKKCLEYREQWRKDTGEVMHPFQNNSVWIHTHPGNSATPSNVDRETFRERNPDIFFVMYILAKGGAQHCEMKLAHTTTSFMVGCTTNADMKEVFKTGLVQPYEVTDEDKAEWAALYTENVTVAPPTPINHSQGGFLSQHRGPIPSRDSGRTYDFGYSALNTRRGPGKYGSFGKTLSGRVQALKATLSDLLFARDDEDQLRVLAEAEDLMKEVIDATLEEQDDNWRRSQRRKKLAREVIGHDRDDDGRTIEIVSGFQSRKEFYETYGHLMD